jgi:hypothetical protein
MSHARMASLLASIAILGLIGPRGARGDLVVSGAFSPNGDLGFVTSPTNLAINYGGDGQGLVYQMNGYVNVQGMNSMSDVGNSADLGNGAPSGIAYTFNASQPTADQLLLTYQFANNTGAALPGFQFLYYVDPDDGANYPYEYATINGAANLGLGLNPSSYQVSDATYGSIFTNLGTGMLSNTNDLPSSSQEGDVSVALGLSVGTLAIGQTATFQVLLSDNGSSLGNFSITQVDDAYPGDSLTISAAVVPEPPSLILLAVGSLLGMGTMVRRKAGARLA